MKAAKFTLVSLVCCSCGAAGSGGFEGNATGGGTSNAAGNPGLGGVESGGSGGAAGGLGGAAGDAFGGAAGGSAGGAVGGGPGAGGAHGELAIEVVAGNAVLEAPEQKSAGSAKAGSTVPGAVKVRVVNQAGPYVGAALPEIGVWLDGPAGIQCKGGVVLTDDEGLATCDLEVGAQPGSQSFSVKIGGAVKFDGVQLHVVP